MQHFYNNEIINILVYDAERILIKIKQIMGYTLYI